MGHDSDTSSVTSTSHNHLRPLFWQGGGEEQHCLPPIHNLMATPPASSTNSPPCSYQSTMMNGEDASRTCASPSPPAFSSFTPPLKPHLHPPAQPMHGAADWLDPMEPPLSPPCSGPPAPAAAVVSERKGSIASLLNSPPELKQLELEEQRYGYQTHFANREDRRRQVHPPMALVPPTDALSTGIRTKTALKRGAPPMMGGDTVSARGPKRKKHHKQKQAPSSSIFIAAGANSDQTPPPPHASLSSSTTSSSSSSVSASSPSSAASSPRLYAPSSSSMMYGERASKGLRHFSKQVCDKVKEHGVTTYDQVVHELSQQQQQQAAATNSRPPFDQKNIRRRVYDALNVLMAIHIIEKDKREIKWRGIPPSLDETHSPAPDSTQLQDDALKRAIQHEEMKQKELTASIDRTKENIQQSMTKYLLLRRLIARNQRDADKHQFMTTLPFFLVQQSRDTLVELQHNGKEAHISCDAPLFNEMDILRHHFREPISCRELNCWVPDHWHQYLDAAAS
ncbi:E2F/DP family winged-helix DNA-binding domain-containing protein [Gongronella butleri]|nr:E2F/DP family winged-helix DNA-binding domain-containing protein [Gongronella butleri]